MFKKIREKKGSMSKVALEVVLIALSLGLIMKVCIPQTETVVKIGNKSNSQLESLEKCLE